MANYSYDTLLNDNVLFLQGVQADLNKYLPSSSDAKRGTAIEGAFYLTTDTHRLYVGRKVETGTDANKVFPTQISAGITTVADSGQLAQVSTATAEEGDFYYIENSNVLAVLRINGNGDKEWVQVNPPSGLTGFDQNAVQSTNDVLVTSSITTAATGDGASKSAEIKFKAGSNVTLTAGSEGAGTAADPTIPTLTIAATDSTYTLNTTATPSGSSNGATVGLKKNGGSTLDTSVTLTGANDIGVTSDANGAVTISGPDFSNKGVAVAAAAQGFLFNLDYSSGAGGANRSVTHSTASTMDPTITYGVNTPIGGVSQTKSTVHFASGDASLDIYTKAQTDSAITAAINSAIAVADAMTYKGTIDTATLSNLKSTGTAKNGDTYKADSNITYYSKTAQKGDLIIIRGTEVNGVIPSTSVDFDIDVIPSGDEPYVAASFGVDPAGSWTPGVNDGDPTYSSTILSLVDDKNLSSELATVNLVNTEKIKITSAFGDNSNQKNVDVKIEHRKLTVTPTENATLSTTTGADTMGTGTYELFVLPSKNSISFDGYGHVSGIAGKKITFKHNVLDDMSVAYNDVTLGQNSTLLSKAGATLAVQDTLNQSASNTVYFESQTLTIASNGAQADADKALSINLKWGSF